MYQMILKTVVWKYFSVTQKHLLSDTGRAILKCETYQRKVAAVVIDEAHCMGNWYDVFL